MKLKCEEHRTLRGPAPKACMECARSLGRLPAELQEPKPVVRINPETGVRFTRRETLQQIHETAWANAHVSMAEVARMVGISYRALKEYKHDFPEEWEVAQREAGQAFMRGEFARQSIVALQSHWKKGGATGAIDVARAASLLPKEEATMPVMFTLDIPRVTSAD